MDEYLKEMAIREESREEGRKEGREEGIGIGREEAIAKDIRILRDFGIGDERILKKIVESHSLSEEKVWELMKKAG